MACLRMKTRPVILESKSQVWETGIKQSQMDEHGPGCTELGRHYKAFEPNVCTRKVTEGF